MSKKSFFYCLSWTLCIFYLQINSHSQTATSSPETSATPFIETENQNSAAKPENLINFGDVIDVDIIGSTEYDWRGRINPEGFLDGLDFIAEPVFALCRNTEVVAADVAKGYSKLLRNPKVTVTIVDRTGRPNSYLYGAVKTPHRFLLQREVRLNELLILAGGLTDKASGEIQIVRQSKLNCPASENKETATESDQKSQKVSAVVNSSSETGIINIKIADLLKGDKEFNPVIANGDIITVLQSEPIYVIGGVLNPKQINVTSKMTVSRAIASAGGLAKNADGKNVLIFRRVAGETKVIQVNLEYIKQEKAEDVVLQKFDIVEVSQSGAAKRRIPPVIKLDESAGRKSLEMPLRIVR